MFRVDSLSVKPRPRSEMQTIQTVTGIAGLGLVGDANSDKVSPRQVLIVSSDDLASLGLSSQDLRANIVLEGNLSSLSSGDLVAFDHLVLRITIPCEPCGRLNAVRTSLSRTIGSRRGLLARVVRGGVLASGERGSLLPFRADALPSDWRYRVVDIVSSIPRGSILTYASLARAAGVQTAYCRAIPAVLRRLQQQGLPVHRIVPAAPAAIEARTSRLLLSEGVLFSDPRAVPYWDPANYYVSQEASIFPAPRESGGVQLELFGQRPAASR